jgi:hypothetical protein
MPKRQTGKKENPVFALSELHLSVRQRSSEPPKYLL